MMLTASLLPWVALSATADPDVPAKGVTLSKDGTKIEEDGHSVEFGANGATKINTQNPDFDRGMEALFADRMREAVDYLGRALQKDPTNPQAHLNRAEAFSHLEDYEHVIEEATAAIGLSQAGWVYHARHSEKSASANDPLVISDRASGYARRGIAKWELHRKEDAIPDFDAAVRFKTTDGTVYIYRGQFYLNQGKFDLAGKDFDAAIALEKNNAYGYGLRALVDVHNGYDGLAASDLFRAGKIDEKVRAQCAAIAQKMRAARAAK